MGSTGFVTAKLNQKRVQRHVQDVDGQGSLAQAGKRLDEPQNGGDGQHGAKAQQVEHCAILHQVAAHRIGVGLEDAGSLIHRGFGGDDALDGYGIKHHDGRRQRAPGIPALLPAAERLRKQHTECKEREKGKHTAQIKRPVDTAAQQAYGNGRGHPYGAGQQAAPLDGAQQRHGEHPEHEGVQIPHVPPWQQYILQPAALIHNVIFQGSRTERRDARLADKVEP